MKYEPGDTVLLLHSNEEGTVVEIMSESMVMVDIAGVRFPVYMDQIDFPYFKRFTEKKLVPPKKDKAYIDSIKKETPTAKDRKESGILVSLIPVFDKDVFDDDVIERFKIYLVNETASTFQFRYEMTCKGTPNFHLNNSVLPFNDFYLHDMPFDEMNDSPKFEFDFTLIPANPKKATHFETSLKIKAKLLFQKIEEMRMKNQSSFSFLLLENYPDKMQDLTPDYNLNTHLYDASKIRQRLEPARSVVDLHIEKLSDNWKGLSNFDILTIQLQNFEKFYNLAVSHRQPNLIVIHGVGTGKLRTEIHEALKLKREVKSFANQYHPNYGFGATEIFFQY